MTKAVQKQKDLDMIEIEDLEQSARDLANDLAQDPEKFAECQEYYEALMGALNATHTDKEQNAGAVFEAFARVIGQLIGNMKPHEQSGMLAYLTIRSKAYSYNAAKQGVAQNIKGRGH